MKYTPDYPERFASIGEARAWMAAFTDWYNEHRHSGIGLHTPASVHYGTAEEIRDLRLYAVLDAAYAAHPERFNRRPNPPKLPEKATINDPAKRTQASQLQKHDTSHFDLTRSGKPVYRAGVAQWKAQQAAKRPKVAKLVTNPQLRDYVQDRLAGSLRHEDGTIVAGPNTPAWRA